jgi:hypothetical protein
MDMKIKMDMKKILGIFLSFNFGLLLPLMASPEQALYCQQKTAPIHKTVKTNDFPSYFFKVHPSGDYIAFIGQNGNQLLDMNKGTEFTIPGMIDPVFSPDGKYLIVPMLEDNYKGPSTFQDYLTEYHDEDDTEEDDSSELSMTFYDFNTVKSDFKGEKFAQTLIRDNESEGVYQSASKLDKQNLLVVTDQDGASIRKYKTKNGKITTNGQLSKPCGNIEKFPTNLPMLSKDGEFLSVYNREENSTQIYNLKKNGDCKLSLDLGIPTGKVAFNRDSSQIAFHVDHFSKDYGSYFTGTASDIIKDVYTVKIDVDTDSNGDKKITPTTWAKVTHNDTSGNGSYYPSFSLGGDIFFLTDKDNYFEFSQVKASVLNFVPYLKVEEGQNSTYSQAPEKTTCVPIEESLQKPFLLGQLWLNICKNMKKASIKDSVLLSMSIPKENCQQLVRENWNNKMAKNFIQELGVANDFRYIRDIKIEDLLSACPESTQDSIETHIIGNWKKRSSASFKSILKQKCLHCHTREHKYIREEVVREFYDENDKSVRVDKEKVEKRFPPIDPDNISASIAHKMVMAVSSPDQTLRMPKESSLSMDEIKVFSDFNQVKQLELASNESAFSSDQYPLTGKIYSEIALEKELKELLQLNKSWLSDDETSKKFIIEQRKLIWCNYGQQGCPEYFKEQLLKQEESLKRENPSITKKDLKEKMNRVELGLKCSAVWKVTSKECNVYWSQSH